jgi:hypothetical protein
MIRSSLPMPHDATDDALKIELDVFARRAGLDIPESRKPALLLGLKDLKRMTALMRQPRTAANEPAGTYSLLSITRGL